MVMKILLIVVGIVDGDEDIADILDDVVVDIVFFDFNDFIFLMNLIHMCKFFSFQMLLF